MSEFTINEFYPGPRHGEIEIKRGDTVVVKLVMRPFMFYKNKRMNFADQNVPLYISMEYGSTLCSDEVTCIDTLHDVFLDAIRTLFNKVSFKSVILPIQSKLLYDFYAKKNKENSLIPDNCVLLYTEECKRLFRSWNFGEKNAFYVDSPYLSSREYFMIIRKEFVELYESQWWNDNQELFEEEQQEQV